MTQVDNSKLIILSSGGTGGHMTPAQALGVELIVRGYHVEVMTDTRGMTFSSIFSGMTLHEVRSGTLGHGILGKLKGAVELGFGIMQALFLLMKLKPAIVIGFGGYPSFPGVYAAQLLKIPTILHEQNAIIGKANAMLAPKAKHIALSLPLVGGLEKREKKRTVLTGNPVRPDIAALHTQPYPALHNDGRMQILIMGGSLGAKVFSYVVPRALAKLPKEYRDRLQIVQQCRADDIEAARGVYEEAGIGATLSTFFDNVDELLEHSHLVICRSGASTVAEVTTAGRPAIFVPYPHHKDQQQKMNADAVADAGGAWMMTESGFTEDTLFARIETFFQNPETLAKAAEKARNCGQPDAAKTLSDLVVKRVDC